MTRKPIPVGAVTPLRKSDELPWATIDGENHEITGIFYGQITARNYASDHLSGAGLLGIYRGRTRFCRELLALLEAETAK
jgi:hypothetical protein